MAFRKSTIISGRLSGNTSRQQSRTLAGPGVTRADLFNDILYTLYILTTGCTWHDVLANYGTKSTVHWQVALAKVHDYQLYESTLEAFEIPGKEEQPMIILTDTAYDVREIRQYN